MVQYNYKKRTASEDVASLGVEGAEWGRGPDEPTPEKLQD